MAEVQRKLVHKQFNSPMGLYSQQNVKETLNRELQAFGSEGIEIEDARPLNLANSAVLRAVEEEEQMKCGYKRVAWPPASEERIVREFTPQPQTQYPPAPAYNQQQQHQPTPAAANAAAVPPTQQQYRAPSHDNYQHPQQQQYQQPPQQQQFPPQPQYQAQAAPSAQKQYQQQPQLGSQYQQPPQQQPAWAQQQPPHQQQQQQYQQPPWVQQPQQQQQPQQPQQLQQQPQYQNPLNQYNQAPHHQQQYPQQQNQFVPQTNQQQFNSYSQPQQQQHTVSHDQVDQQHYQPQLPQDLRGASPGIITLRKEAPITQQPTPVYTSQPAAISYRESSTDSLGGSSMRGDLKWPPPEYKEAAAKENDERRKLASGPVCRPRKINRDYTTFFAKNALSHHYPSYKVPPGTQHMTY